MLFEKGQSGDYGKQVCLDVDKVPLVLCAHTMSHFLNFLISLLLAFHKDIIFILYEI